MKIIALNFEGKIVTKFEWDVTKGQWSAKIDDARLKKWWGREEYLYEKNFHNFTSGHFSFRWGSKRIFNLEQKGFEVLVVEWRDWDLVKLDLEQYYKIDEFQDIKEQKLLKAKIYLKLGEKPPKGLEVKRGPKGGLYYETTAEIAPKEKPSSEKEILGHTLDEKLQSIMFADDQTLSILSTDSSPEVRARVAEKANQTILHQMMTDENVAVRVAVADEIDQDGLHKMLKDPNFLCRLSVSDRIDESGLNEMLSDENLQVLENVVNEISSVEKLEPLLKHPNSVVRKRANIRMRQANLSLGMIKHFKETGEIKLTLSMKNAIKKIAKTGKSSIKIIEAIDTFYKNTKFKTYHSVSKADWEESSSAPLADQLKDSIMRQFGGKIYYHGALDEGENWKDFMEDMNKLYPRELVDDYVKCHKAITREFLDTIYSDTDEITLYRGTSIDEVTNVGDKVNIKSNAVSSWTSKKEVAKGFAGKEGVMLETIVHKDDIWSTYLTHAYEGGEREFLVISPKDRKGVVIK